MATIKRTTDERSFEDCMADAISSIDSAMRSLILAAEQADDAGEACGTILRLSERVGILRADLIDHNNSR